MSPTKSLLSCAALAALTLGAIVPAAPAADVSPAARPHSKIVTYAHDGIDVRRLVLSVHRGDHVLRPYLRVTVSNGTRHTVVREVRVGPCNRGTTTGPICKTAAKVRMRIAPGQTFSRQTGLPRMSQPSSRLDLVQAVVVAPGQTRQPFGYPSRADAVLQLKGSAWRGPGAGADYGVTFSRDAAAARRLNFDVPATSRERAYIDVKWEGAAAPDHAVTSMARCEDGSCTDYKALAPETGRSQPGIFGRRFDYDAHGADTLRLHAAVGMEDPLFDARLPWPG